jgi:hypothetical protein
MIQVKSIEVLRALMGVNYHPRMLDLLLWVDGEFQHTIITSGYRHGRGSVHNLVPCRGVDLRSWVFEDPQDVTDKINEHWEYDPERPDKQCAILHDTGSGNHIHLQVHPNTRERKNVWA